MYQSSQAATIGSLLLPNHKGDCLSFRLQLQQRGSWGFDTVTTCLRLNTHSAVGVRLPGDPRAVGIPIRIRSEWKGDDRNGKANGKWLYLKFVAGRGATEYSVPRSSRTQSTPSPGVAPWAMSSRLSTLLVAVVGSVRATRT